MEEILAVIVVIFPGVLAIHDDGHNMRTFRALQAFVDCVQRVDHILRGCFASHARIIEADLVRNHPVAEEDANFFAGFSLNVVGAVESVGVFDYAVIIARETISSKPQARHEHRFAGLHPLVACLADQRNDFLRHGALARPKPADVPPKDGLIHLDALLQVESGILGMAELLFGHDRLGVADQSQVCVVDKGQDRMSVGCGCDLQDARIL